MSNARRKHDPQLMRSGAREQQEEADSQWVIEVCWQLFLLLSGLVLGVLGILWSLVQGIARTARSLVRSGRKSPERPRE